MRTKTALAALAAIAVLAAGCSSGSGGGGSSGSGGGAPAASGGENGTSASSADLSYVKAQIDKYSQKPQFTPPGKALDAGKLAGKKVFTIPVSSAIPFCQAVDDKMTDMAKKAGLDFTVFKNQGQQSQWVQGFNAAASQQAALINIFCGLDAEKVAPQIQQASSHGTPVIAAHTYAIGQKPLSGLKAVVYGAYIRAAKLMADWAIYDTKAKANVLVLTSPSTSNSPFMEKAMKAEFAAHCPSCKVTYFGVNVPDWAKSIDPKVRAAITSDPDLNYIIPIYDGMVQFVTPAITATGSQGKVHVASFNAIPAVLDQIRTGDVVRFEVGEDPAWLAGAILDQDMRVLLGMPPVEKDQSGVRIFTKDNVKDAGVPAKLLQGYGNAAELGFLKLWGID